jgi:hypothetical protein
VKLLALLLTIPLLALGLSLVLFLGAVGLLGPLQEALTGEYPAVRVDAYLRAVAEGREEKAVLVWQVPPGVPGDPRTSARRERRASITRELIQAGVQSRYATRDVEWWGTCCEPHVVADQRAAGLARMRLRLVRRDGTAAEYTFDVGTRQAYFGALMNFPAREWLLVDVYPEGEDPLAFSWVRGRQGSHPVSSRRPDRPDAAGSPPAR